MESAQRETLDGRGRHCPVGSQRLTLQPSSTPASTGSSTVAKDDVAVVAWHRRQSTHCGKTTSTHRGSSRWHRAVPPRPPAPGSAQPPSAIPAPGHTYGRWLPRRGPASRPARA